MFTPFGIVSKELGKKLINEVVVLDIRTNVPIISIQPFTNENYQYAVKIKTMNVEKHDDLQKMISYQVRKYNACMKCLKCESICRFGAITVTQSLAAETALELNRLGHKLYTFVSPNVEACPKDWTDQVYAEYTRVLRENGVK